MKTALRVFRYLLNYKKDVLLNIGFNIFYVFFSLFSFVMIVPFLSVLFGLLPSPETCPAFSFDKDTLIDYVSYYLNYYKESHGIFACLFYISSGYLIFAFFASLCRYFAMYFLSPIRNGVIGDLRADIYHKITVLPISFFTAQRKGDLISRMTADLADIEWSVLSCLQMMVKDPFMVIAFLITLLFMSVKLVLFILITLPLAMFFINKIGASLKRNSMKAQTQTGILTSKIEETLGALRVIKAYNTENMMYENYAKDNHFFTRINTKVYRRRELATPLTEIFSILTLVVIVLFGGTMVLHNEINAAVLIGFTVLFARIVAPLQSISSAYYSFQKADAAAKRIYQVFDAEEIIIEKDNAVIMPPLRKEIVFENVSFAYKNGQTVLSNINITIRKGETVAFVGHSGAGKTTLLDLISRFADTSEGKITFDGMDIRNFNINSLRSNTGLVMQESILFNDTIFNNIAFGKPNTTLDEVVSAAKIANAHEFIIKLPKGYYSFAGDKALQLSGGQRQRLCIARAVINNPCILLLDEATSALDTENEFLVRESLRSAMQSRTTLIVAHRLSSVIYADRIFVIEHGKIVSYGTHEELLTTSPLYASLVASQILQ
ncbi:MAG: ABC transporter ATP-binding protein/permease [Bacteroidales bacterium]|jgi:subfamily B ATP-binding cassette protein MsbA|nr:ABC transporter ATP-binding protein/permease [Bacteroidales bacterium]